MTTWMPSSAKRVEEQPWMPSSATAVEDQPPAPGGQTTSIAEAVARDQRPVRIQDISDRTGVPANRLERMYDELDASLWPSGAEIDWPSGQYVYPTQKERDDIVDDVALAIADLPGNLVISGIRFSEGVLGAMKMLQDATKEGMPTDRQMEAELGVSRQRRPEFGPPDLVDGGAKWLQDKAQAKIDAQRDLTLRNAPFAQVARVMVQNIAPTAAAIGITLITGNAAAGLAALFVTTTGSEYQDLTGANVPFKKAAFFAMLNGAAEVGGEMLVLPTFIRGLKKGLPFRSLLAVMGENGGQEAVTGFTQTLMSYVAKKTEAGMGLEEAIRESIEPAWRQAIEDGLVGAEMALGIDAVSIPSSYFITQSQKAATIEKARSDRAGYRTRYEMLGDYAPGGPVQTDLLEVIERYELSKEAKRAILAAVPAAAAPTEPGNAVPVGAREESAEQIPPETPAEEVITAGEPPETAKVRRAELAKTSRYIKGSIEYRTAEEESTAKGQSSTGVSLFYVEPGYRGDVESAFGEKGVKGANRLAWQMISFDKSAGQAWDVAQQELGWGTRFDEFLAKVADLAEGDIAPDVLDVAQSSGNIDLETAALKRAMLQSGQPLAEINQAIEENVRGAAQSGYVQLSDADVDAIIEAHRIKMAGALPAEGEIDVSVGAASGKFMSRRRAIERAQKESKKTGAPIYVVQRANGTYAAQRTRPATGHYTVVDMKQALADQVRFVKQASPTAEESFDYGEHPRESEAGLTAVNRLRKRFKEKGAVAAALRQELLDTIVTLPLALQPKFQPILDAMQATRATKVNQRDLMRAIIKTERLLKGLDKKDAINELKKTWKHIKKTYRRGQMALGAIDQATRDRLNAVMGNIDLAELSEGKKKDLASLARHLNDLANAVAEGMTTLRNAEDAIIRIPPGRIQSLQRLGKTPLPQMHAEDIRDITRSLENLVHGYETKEQLKGARRARTATQMREQAIDELIPTPGAVRNRQAVSRGEIEDLSKTKAKGFFSRVFSTDSSHIDTLVEDMVGTGDTATAKLLDIDLHEGWKRRAELIKKAVESAQAKLKAIGFTYTDFQSLQGKRVVMLSGERKAIPGEDALAFYCHAKWEQNVRRLLGTEGLVINGQQAPTIRNLAELDAIIATLTDKERAYGDIFGEINRELFQPAINRVSKELEGFEIAIEDDYFPIHRVMGKRLSGEVSQEDIAIEDYGQWQPRTGGTQPIRITPYTQELMNALQTNAMYHGMAIPMHNARTLINSRQWQKATEAAGRGDAKNAIFTILKRVQGYPTTESYVEGMGKFLLNRISKGILSARIGTVLSQTSVLPMTVAEVDMKHFVGVVPSPARLEKLKEHSAVLWERWASSQVSIEMGNIAAKNAAENLLFGHMGLMDHPLRGMTAMDAEAIELIAGAVENELASTRPELARGTEEFDQAVADRTEYIVRRTQQMWDMLDRSVISGNLGLASRVVFIFRSSQEAMLNVQLRANHRLAKSEWTAEDWMAWSRQTGSVLSSIAMNTAMRAGFKAALAIGAVASMAALGIIEPGEPPPEDEQDDRESVIEKLGMDFISDLVALVPLGNIIGPAIREMPRRLRGQAHWAAEPYDNPIYGLVTDGYAIIQHGTDMAKQMATGETFQGGPNVDEPKWHRSAWELADSALQFASKVTGAPYSAPRTEIIGPVIKAKKENPKETY